MKINLLNTSHGLKPMYDEDFDEKKKLRIGEVYTAEIKLARNYDFHRKFFSLINTAFEYLDEEQTSRLGGDSRIGKDNFRKDMLIAAGVVNTYYSVADGEMRVEAKSISFSSMDNSEFQDVYDAVKNALFRTVLHGISEEEFNKNLINY